MSPPKISVRLWCIAGCAALVASSGLAACEAIDQVVGDSCELTACEAAQRPVSGGGMDQGIAGVVAEMSDAGANGCFPCSWANARLSIWQTELLVTTITGGEAVVDAGPPMLTVRAAGRYQQALAPGSYLVCALPGACAGVTVKTGEVVTANVLTGHRPYGLVLFDGEGRAQSAERVFQLNRNPPVVSIQIEGVGHFVGSEAARLQVYEPGTPRAALVRFNFGAVKDLRRLSFWLDQPDPWPLAPRFDLSFPHADGNGTQLTDSAGTESLVSRAGETNIVLEGVSRFSGNFTAGLSASATGPSIERTVKGTFSGEVSFTCLRLAGAGGDSWVADEKFESPFCSALAKQLPTAR